MKREIKKTCKGSVRRKVKVNKNKMKRERQKT